MKNRTNFKGLIIFFLIFSLIFSALAIYGWCDYNNIKTNYIKTQANIIEITFDEDVYVTFDANGELKQVKLDDFTDEWKIGDVIEIYYNPNTFEACSSELLSVVPILLTCIAGFFALMLIIVALINKKNTEKMRWLFENGRKVYAKVINLSSNFDMMASQRSFFIECEYNGIIFKESILTSFFNKSFKDFNFANKQIAVYYNFENPKQYYMDFDDIVEYVEQ